MAGKVVGWAFDQDAGSVWAKMVLVKLADNANEDGVCWPSIAKIVRHTQMSESSVRRNLKALVELGLVTVEKRYVGGVPLPNVYHLHIELVRPLPSAEDVSEIDDDAPGEGVGVHQTPPLSDKAPDHGVTETPTLPGSGGDGVSGTGMVSLGTPQKPSKEPSEEPSLSRGAKKSDLDSFGSRPAPGEDDPKAWDSSIIAEYREIPNADKSASEESARQRWEQISWQERPTVEEILFCLRAYARELHRLNVQNPTRPRMVRHLSNWLKEKQYEGFLVDARKDIKRAAQLPKFVGKGDKPATADLSGISQSALDKMQRAEFEPAEIVAWFDGCRIVDAESPAAAVIIEIPTGFRYNWVANHFESRLKRAFGRVEIVEKKAA